MTRTEYLTDLSYLCAIGAALYWCGYWLAVGVCEAVERAIARARGSDDDEAYGQNEGEARRDGFVRAMESA